MAFIESRFYPIINVSVLYPEVVVRRCSVKKLFLKISQNSQENTCVRASFFNKVASLRPATLLKKETLEHVFSCKFCEIFKNTIFYRTPEVATSVYHINGLSLGISITFYLNRCLIIDNELLIFVEYRFIV